MGRFQESKRFDILLDLMAMLKAEDVLLLLVGDGPMFAALKSKAASLGISDRVVFTGEDADARLWMSAFDIFCFPSEDEGLPNAVMEAAAAGVPIVGWRSPFLEEILEDGRSAVLVERGDVQALQGAITALIRDPERRNRLGLSGRSRVLNTFSVRRLVDGMTLTYERMFSGLLINDASGSERENCVDVCESRAVLCAA